MREEGTVLETKGEMAIVQIKRSAACDTCKCCHVAEQSEFMTTEALNKVQANVGDRVVIEIEQKEVLAASTIVYILPLVLMIVGYIIGSYLGKVIFKSYSHEAGIIFGFTFLAFSYLIMVLAEKHAVKTRWLQPVVVELFREESK